MSNIPTFIYRIKAMDGSGLFWMSEISRKDMFTERGIDFHNKGSAKAAMVRYKFFQNTRPELNMPPVELVKYLVRVEECSGGSDVEDITPKEYAIFATKNTFPSLGGIVQIALDKSPDYKYMVLVGPEMFSDQTAILDMLDDPIPSKKRKVVFVKTIVDATLIKLGLAGVSSKKIVIWDIWKSAIVDQSK